MPLNDKQRAAFARDLQRAVARVAPDWTDFGTHDPGVTVLELLAFALDDLQFRHAALDPRARRIARDVASKATALAADVAETADDCGPGPTRVNYFTGMVLGSDDFSAEQDYFRQRLSRLNRLLHGSGVITGLGVTVAGAGDAAGVTIAPGFALDPAGNELCVTAPCSLSLPAAGGALLITIAYRERPCRTGGDAQAAPPIRAATPRRRCARAVLSRPSTRRWRSRPRPMPSRSRGCTASAAAGGSIRRSSRLAFGAEDGGGSDAAHGRPCSPSVRRHVPSQTAVARRASLLDSRR